MAIVSLRNTTPRNVSVQPVHGSAANGRIMIPALATLEFEQSDIKHVKNPIEALLKAGVLELVTDKVVSLDVPTPEVKEEKKSKKDK